MSFKDRANRRRWAIQQKELARASYKAPDDSERLAGLQQMAAMMEEMPHMARTLAAVKAEIDRLSAAT